VFPDPTRLRLLRYVYVVARLRLRCCYTRWFTLPHGLHVHVHTVFCGYVDYVVVGYGYHTVWCQVTPHTVTVLVHTVTRWLPVLHTLPHTRLIVYLPDVTFGSLPHTPVYGCLVDVYGWFGYTHGYGWLRRYHVRWPTDTRWPVTVGLRFTVTRWLDCRLVDSPRRWLHYPTLLRCSPRSHGYGYGRLRCPLLRLFG